MKTAWYARKWVNVLFHAAAWILLFSLPYLLRQPYNENQTPRPIPNNPASSYLFAFLMDLTWIVFFYFNAYYLVPRFIYRRKFWLYTILQLTILAWVLTQSMLLIKLFSPAKPFNIRPHILVNFFIFLFMLAASTAYLLIRDKMKADKMAQDRENENLKTELSLLRSQVSPHFMFNVLNNMVSLARKKSDLLEPSLIKLSSLMRYMLYETDEEKVSLDKEIEYLQSYIDLQQQRFGKKVNVNVNMQIKDGQYQIEPMLLIPFVENAFKHGTGMIEDAQIDIELTTANNAIVFSTRNKFNDSSVEIKDKTSGIGLTNVTRRLNILYGRNHWLKITKKDNWFEVSLKISLN